MLEEVKTKEDKKQTTFKKAQTLAHKRHPNCLEPQRALNFKSVPSDVSFRLENEKWGEVFKFHPVLKVKIKFLE